MVLLFLFYINVCIMAIQVSTRSDSRSSHDYLKQLELAYITNNDSESTQNYLKQLKFAQKKGFHLRRLQKYPKKLEFANDLNDFYLKANEISTEESQRSVKELAERAILDLHITNASMTAFVDCYTQVDKRIAEDRMPEVLSGELPKRLKEYGLGFLDSSELTRKLLDSLNRTFTETQTNETEASCALLAPSSEYDFEPIKKMISAHEVRTYRKHFLLFLQDFLKDSIDEVKRVFSPSQY
uniref:Hypotheticial protein n=1 Tax=Schistosoma japonicum TaxID=6182 RepID=C7TYB1_SCHJA|nr:hypotheticial protein [Schistosoma japonicum]CAX82620.1 hypotheticial protein [Schistosoma japonicum]